jgi:hypothetical protein
MSPQIGLPHDFFAWGIKPTCVETSMNCWPTDTDEKLVTNPTAAARIESAFLICKGGHESREPRSAALVEDPNKRVITHGCGGAVTTPAPGRSARRFRVILIAIA